MNDPERGKYSEVGSQFNMIGRLEVPLTAALLLLITLIRHLQFDGCVVDAKKLILRTDRARCVLIETVASKFAGSLEYSDYTTSPYSNTY